MFGTKKIAEQAARIAALEQKIVMLIDQKESAERRHADEISFLRAEKDRLLDVVLARQTTGGEGFTALQHAITSEPEPTPPVEEAIDRNDLWTAYRELHGEFAFPMMPQRPEEPVESTEVME